MRLDQRMAKIKKSLGIDEPRTLRYVAAQERVEDEKTRMEKWVINAEKRQEENWWERHYREHDKRKERHEKRVVDKLKHEDAKRHPVAITCRGNSRTSGIF